MTDNKLGGSCTLLLDWDADQMRWRKEAGWDSLGLIGD